MIVEMGMNTAAKALTAGIAAGAYTGLVLYNPLTNSVRLRPTQDGGRGYYVIGHHEIMFPILAAMIKSRMRSQAGS